MVKFNWENGRQNSGYFKCKLFEKPNKIDCYLLKYPKGSFVPEHFDPAPSGKKHFRVNLTLKKPKSGGHFKCWRYKTFLFGRAILFRPDTYKHSVSEIKEGERLVLSVGWLK